MIRFSEYLKKEIDGRKLCVFGMGSFGMASTDELIRNGFAIDCFVDNSPNEKSYKDIKRISFEELTNNVNEYLVIVTLADALMEVIPSLKAINAKFILMGSPYRFKFEEDRLKMSENEYQECLSKTRQLFHDEKSLCVFDKMVELWGSLSYSPEKLAHIKSEIPYFDKEILSDIDSFDIVDCGAFTGDTLDSFFTIYSVDDLRKYYAFELSRKNYLLLNKNINDNYEKKTLDKIVTINKGVSNHEGQIDYVDDLGAASRLSGGQKTGDTAIVTTIDNELKGKKITFIKMDIEGAEMEALEGAKETISIQKPILSICVYHKLTDLWEIPLYIKSIDSDYSFYLRQYSSALVDTVLYAIPLS